MRYNNVVLSCAVTWLKSFFYRRDSFIQLEIGRTLETTTNSSCIFYRFRHFVAFCLVFLCLFIVALCRWDALCLLQVSRNSRRLINIHATRDLTAKKTKSKEKNERRRWHSRKVRLNSIKQQRVFNAILYWRIRKNKNRGKWKITKMTIALFLCFYSSTRI